MPYTDFDVLGLESERVYGKISLETETQGFLTTYKFDETSLEGLSNIIPYGDFSDSIAHEDYDGKLTLWLSGYPIFHLVPSAPKSSSGCKLCGNPGKFIRTALVCPTHGTLIGGI